MPRDSRSPPRKSRRDRSRSRSGGRDKKPSLDEWGSDGTIVDLRKSGFGFIRPSTGKVNNMDLYFHAKECDKNSPFDEMRLDDEVSYEVAYDDRNGKAMAVKVSMKEGGGSKKKSSRKDSRSRSDSRDRRRRR
eukprot:TRINITY_DN112998_c0_g1_i1.p1 TRINITY_DN112998_c0_g1~~TRINITY_DN112998_c0_g1_i1.p1  ORF type:complete len:133 (-),score=28.30 TRINITY_DN112998_c0_g1_i1:111-509(-)